MPDEPRVEPTAVLLTRIRTGLAFVFSIVVVLFLIFDAALLIWLLIQIFGTTSVLENKFGINKWLSMAVALILTGPLFWGAKREFQALSEKKESRTLAQVAFGLYTCVYFVAMFILQRDVAFDPKTGKAVQCYSFDLEGNIRLGSCGGYDTRTGQVLQPVTPEILDAFEQQQSGNKPRPVPVEIFLREGGFDRNTGLSRVWFARRANGGFELFEVEPLPRDLQPVGQNERNGEGIVRLMPQSVEIGQHGLRGLGRMPPHEPSRIEQAR